jgi:ABC-2 type transport system permease protein
MTNSVRPGERSTPSLPRVALVVGANDLRRKLRDRTALLLGIVTPLLMAAVIGLAFGGGISFAATIAVVDGDGSAISQGIVDGLVEGAPAGTPVTFARATDVAGANADLDAGKVDAVIVVPSAFGASISAMASGGRGGTLRVLTDANKRIAGDVARSVADGLSARVSASVLAIQTALTGNGTVTDPAAIQRIVAEGQRVTVPIALEQVDAGGRYPPVAYFGASMGILFLFFTVGGGARSLITERKEGTLTRVRSAPVSDAGVLLGKSGAVLVIALLSLLTIWAVTSVVFRASWGDPLAVLTIIVSVVIAVAGISALVAGLARTDAQADGLTAIVAFGFALLGGSFFQSGSLPPLLQTLALATPNGWALRALTRIGASDAGLIDILPSAVVLLAIGLVTAAIGIQGLKRKALA